MRADITGLNLQELLEFLKKFPSGRVAARGDVAYWDFDMNGREIITHSSPENYPTINKAAKSVGSAQNWVQGAQESLFRAFG